MKNKVYFHTLGCSKNDVDTGIMESILDKNKYELEKDPNSAEIIIVNTCGFIDAAKEESIDAIIRFAQLKNRGLKKLLLAGCLAQRYADELIEEIPEADGIIGTGNLSDINEVLDQALVGNKSIKTDTINSKHLENAYKEDVAVVEYVKISEGCDNNCTYCIIPKLRGKNRSRKIEDIFAEVSYLVSKGTREIILIAQNTSDYGIDIYGEFKLASLIDKISKIQDLKWIRLLYLYPDHFNDDLINQFKNNKKLLKYADIPLQHHSDRVLKAMNRRIKGKEIEALIEKLKNEIPDMVLRTTYIVGFPGEDEDDFKTLLSFVKNAEFLRLGVFTYSKEEGTPAFNFSNQVDEDVKIRRRDSIMQEQMNISGKLLQSFVGKRLETLIEECVDETTYVGRTYIDSPDIDGCIYVSSNRKLKVGEFVDVLVTDSLEYDLIGEII
ncbi:30S ribosomal protein S12 methylthiotransferase RimO [Peptoniphilus sp. GNH]|nr:ribosomal protein S12 methylthiotransferase RimO [Clostridiales bacterium KA00134]UHR03101.1 30S ribosomal protein S12 methylthiotransferase RimO [Peptoniphilus sp. GNH]